MCSPNPIVSTPSRLALERLNLRILTPKNPSEVSASQVTVYNPKIRKSYLTDLDTLPDFISGFMGMDVPETAGPYRKSVITAGQKAQEARKAAISEKLPSSPQVVLAAPKNVEIVAQDLDDLLGPR